MATRLLCIIDLKQDDASTPSVFSSANLSQSWRVLSTNPISLTQELLKPAPLPQNMSSTRRLLFSSQHRVSSNAVALKNSDLPLLLPDVEDYKPSDGGESPLAKAEDWLVVEDPETGQRGRRETNTMPQWAGSCW